MAMTEVYILGFSSGGALPPHCLPESGGANGTPKSKVGWHFSKKSKSGEALFLVTPHCPPPTAWTEKYPWGGGGKISEFI